MRQRFLANVSAPAANKLIDAFVEMTDSLATMPERSPWLEHDAIPFQKYRKLVFGSCDVGIRQLRRANWTP